jgi:hypothetical protein
MGYSVFDDHDRPAWNPGRKIGAKRALKQKEVWAIRFWLDQEGRLRDRALFDLAIDSKLRGCDLVRVRIGDLVTGNAVRGRRWLSSARLRGPSSSKYWSLREPRC